MADNSVVWDDTPSRWIISVLPQTRNCDDDRADSGTYFNYGEIDAHQFPEAKQDRICEVVAHPPL